jgi:hypothetical protein
MNTRVLETVDELVRAAQKQVDEYSYASPRMKQRKVERIAQVQVTLLNHTIALTWTRRV